MAVKKIIVFLALLLPLLMMAACSLGGVINKTQENESFYLEKTEESQAYTPLPKQEDHPTPQPSQPVKEESQPLPQASQADYETPAGAYFLIIQNLFEVSPALNDTIKYIAVDLSETMLEEPDAFIRIMEDYCEESGYTLLLDTIEGLADKGYVNEMHFDEGITFHFSDAKLTVNRLVTDAMKWRSGQGAIGATFTVKKVDKAWEIAEKGAVWIS